jgi:hypothetical protein
MHWVNQVAILEVEKGSMFLQYQQSLINALKDTKRPKKCKDALKWLEEELDKRGWKPSYGRTIGGMRRQLEAGFYNT